MRSNLVVTVLTAVLAIGAGVAIAGLPSTTPGAELRVLVMPTISTDPNVTVPTATVEPLVTEPPVSVKSATTTTPASTTVTEANATTSTTTTTSVGGITVVTRPTSTTTTTAPAAPDPADDLRERASLDVSVANGGAVNGVATATARALETEGYSAVQPVDAENPAATTTVYFGPGLELEASRLATDLGWDPVAIAPISDMPPLATDATFELVAMIGLDNAPPASP